MVEDIDTLEEVIKEIEKIKYSFQRLLEILEEKGMIDLNEKMKLEIE